MSRTSHPAWAVAALLGAAASIAAARPPDRAPKPPNFIVFLADDLGWGDLGCYGHPRIRTPNIDRFAREGMRFSQCYSASSVCSPSRSAILTGRTPYRNGVFTWIPAGREIHLRTSEITLPELLGERGYATCHVGKWHLNGHFNSELQPQPDDHGYDWWFGTQNNAAPSHRDPTNFVRNRVAVGPLQGYSAVLVVDEAIGWLREHRDADAPFFLAVWTHEPHLPIESAPRFMEPYADIDDAGMRQHHGNVTQLDHAFGKLMATVDELELRDDTLVFFTSDNGPEGDGQRGRTRGSTGGLRGRKRAMYEGGIRVPGIARWPGRIEPGSESSEPIIGSDVFATACDIVGIPLPGDRTIDGASMLPAFDGETIDRRVPMYWRWYGAPHGLQIAMRKGDLKILAPEDLSRFELYDLARDPREQHDLAADEPEKLAELSAELIALNAAIELEGPDWWKGYGQRRPRPLTKGVDRTGRFDVVIGGTAREAGERLVLEGGGEAFALHRLDAPIADRAVFELDYETLRDGGTRNACLVFGATENNADLVKVGSMIGMSSHGIFQGSWSALRRGAVVERDYDQGKKLAVRATVDLGARTVRAVIDGEELSWKLPEGLDRIAYYGYYVKGTASSFAPITLRRGR